MVLGPKRVASGARGSAWVAPAGASAGVGGTNNSAGPAPSGPVPAEIYCKVSYLRKFKETAAYEAFSYRPTTAEGGSKALTVTVPLSPTLKRARSLASVESFHDLDAAHALAELVSA